MNRSLLFLLVTVIASSQGYRFYEKYRPTECGENISGKEGIILPAKETCNLKVQVPEGSTFTFTLIGDDASLANCHRILIVDETTQAKYPLCPSMTFSGTSKLYSIQVKKLLHPVKAHVDIDDTVIHCGQLIRREKLDHPLILVKDKPAVCYLVIRTSDVLLFQRNGASDEECDARLEVTQGRHIRNMVKSTGNFCLDSSAVEVEIACGLAVIYFDAPIGSSLNITALPSDKKEVQKILDCPDE